MENRRNYLGRRLMAVVVSVLALAGAVGVEAQNSVVPPIAEAKALAREFRGVGPAVSGSATVSQLPSAAQKFIATHDGEVVKIEKDFNPVEYDVVLADGIEIEFDVNGIVTEIDAPDGGVLGADVVKDVVPQKAMKKLKEIGADNLVTEVKRTKGGFDVDFVSVLVNGTMFNEAHFDRHGNLQTLRYDND